MKRTGLTIALLFLVLAQADAREAVCLLQNDAELSHDGPEDYGLWLSHFPSGELTRLIDRRVRFSALSPDGGRVAFTVNDSIYIMDNNGAGRRCIVAGPSQGYEDWGGQLNQDATGIYWSTNGIFWIHDNKIYRYRVDTDRVSSLPIDLLDIDGATHCDTDGIVSGKGRCYHASRDGRHTWIESNWDPPVDSIYCGVRGYSRGGRLRLEWNEDFTSFTPLWRTQWGHGRMMSADGHLFLVAFGFHRNLYITKQHGTSLETLYGWEEYDPPYNDPGMEARSIVQCINNDSLVCSNAYCAKDACLPEGLHLYVWNWRTRENYGELSMPDQQELNAIMPVTLWDGPLPVVGTDPWIELSRDKVVFSYDGAAEPAPKEVIVTNTGSGALGPVQVSIAPSTADWLLFDVQSNAGDTQTVRYSLNTLAVTQDSMGATVTIHGGGAANSVEHTVIVYKGDVLAPPTLTAATAVGDSLLDVQLDWEDNSSRESGFRIERGTADSDWATIGHAPADTTGYLDKRLDYDTKYTYRIRAYKTTEDSTRVSEPSNEQSVRIFGIPWIVVDAPVQGENLVAGTPYTIRWRANLISQVYLEASMDAGETWETITVEGGILSGADIWGAFPWTVPDLAGSSVIIKVNEYLGDEAATSGEAQIVPAGDNAAGPRGHEARSKDPFTMSANVISVKASYAEALTVTVRALNGAVRVRKVVQPGDQLRIDNAVMGKGVYLVELSGEDTANCVTSRCTLVR